MRIETDSFALTSTGRAGLDGTLNVQAMVSIDPELSMALIKSLNELQYLADAQGSLNIPVVVGGSVAHPTVQPDVHYVASKLIQQKAQELIGGWLEKALGVPEGTIKSRLNRALGRLREVILRDFPTLREDALP